MLIAYYDIEKVYNSNYNFWEIRWPFHIAEEMPENFSRLVSWDFLERNCRYPQCSYHVEERRKGRILCNSAQILETEWAKPDLTVVYERSFVLADPSIIDLLNYYDINKAAEYLKERGIDITEGVNKQWHLVK